MSTVPEGAKNPSFVLYDKFDVRFEDRPVPELEDSRSVKIAVKKTGICGSDVHFYVAGSMGDWKPNGPMVLGHESSGEILEVGKDVKTLKVGDNVALEPGIASRYSKEFKMGKYNLCPEMKFAACPHFDGTVTDGTLARYYVLPEDLCVKLPQGVSLEEGALVEPLSVAVHAVKQMGVTPCTSAIVFGAGPIGLLCTSVLKAWGATTVVTVDLFQERLDVAKEFGATHTFIPSKEDSPEESAKKIVELIGGEKPEFALDASGAEYSITCGVEILAAGGLFMQVGNGKKDWIQFAVTRLVGKEVTFKGSFRYNYGDYIKAVDLIATGKVNVKKLVTHRVKFGEAEMAYNLVKDGKAIKVVIDGPE